MQKNLAFLFLLRSVLVSWIFQLICAFFPQNFEFIGIKFPVMFSYFLCNVSTSRIFFFTHETARFGLLSFIYFLVNLAKVLLIFLQNQPKKIYIVYVYAYVCICRYIQIKGMYLYKPKRKEIMKKRKYLCALIFIISFMFVFNLLFFSY